MAAGKSAFFWGGGEDSCQHYLHYLSCQFKGSLDIAVASIFIVLDPPRVIGLRQTSIFQR